MRNVLFLSYHAPYCDVFLVVVFAEDELRFPRSRPAGSCTQFSEVKTQCKLDNDSSKSFISILKTTMYLNCKHLYKHNLYLLDHLLPFWLPLSSGWRQFYFFAVSRFPY